METLKVRIVIMSHLSDVQENLNGGNPDYSNHRINFVKFLLMKYPNTDTYINPHTEYEEFRKKESIID